MVQIKFLRTLIKNCEQKRNIEIIRMRVATKCPCFENLEFRRYWTPEADLCIYKSGTITEGTAHRKQYMS